MPIKTPFFQRMSEACTSMNWKEWAGYYAVSSYEVLHDVEYYAFRNSAGLLDVTPLFKYRIRGRDAAKFLSQIMVRDITKMKEGRVAYLCWCMDDGKVIDDGTVMYRSTGEFFVTSADPCLAWFSHFTRQYDISIEDVSNQIAGLALQGPTSRDILNQLCDSAINELKYFGTVQRRILDFDVHISRTGYTGDLGFEIWVQNEDAIALWDAFMESGRNYGIRPAGLDALDVTRIEAGLILKNVDYYNALHVLIEDRKSSPFEISLGWTVQLDRPPFNGQKALIQEKRIGSKWAIMGLEISWTELEDLYKQHGLPPEVSTPAWRASIPVYADRSRKRQIGYATSGTWSPILKKNIALATIESRYGKTGTMVHIEITVEHKRYVVSAIVKSPQFFNPERKRSIPAKDQVA